MLPAFTEQPITPEELIQAAIVAAARDSQVLRRQIRTVHEK
jgi:hypothetical protein